MYRRITPGIMLMILCSYFFAATLVSISVAEAEPDEEEAAQ